MHDDMLTQEEVEKYQREGHTFHCAMRILIGDGECECGKRGHIPGGISRQMYQGVCSICLVPDGEEHKEWCSSASNQRRSFL